MKKLLLILIVSCFLSGITEICYAQGQPVRNIASFSAASGGCQNSTTWTDYTLGTFAWCNNGAWKLSSAAGLAFTGTAIFTNTQQNEPIFSLFNGINPGTEFSAVQGGNFATSAFAAGILAPVTSTVHQVNGLAGYVRTLGTSSASVGVYGQCRSGVINGACWGGNFLASDIAGFASLLNGIEIDYGVNNAGTTGTGLSINGSWTAQSTNSNALVINKPGTFFWNAGLVFATGATNVSTPAISLGPIAAGVNQQSQELSLVSNDTVAGTHTATFRNQANGNLFVTSPLEVNGAIFGSGSISADPASGSASPVLGQINFNPSSDTKDYIGWRNSGFNISGVGLAGSLLNIARSDVAADIEFFTGTPNPIQRMVVGSGGVIGIGGPISSLSTNTALTIQSGVDAATTGGSANLTLRGENVTAGGTNNQTGSDVIIQSGITTGTAAPTHVKIQGPALGLTSANTQNPLVTEWVRHAKAGSTTSATPTTIFNIASATNTGWGLEILVHVDLISSTPNVCSTTERFSLSGTNNNGAFGTVNVVSGTTSTLCSTGTLTLAVTATAANPSVISVTPTWGTITSITSATITVEIENVSRQEITLL